MKKQMKEIVSLYKKIQGDTMLVPSGTWSEERFFNNGDSFKSYTNNNRDYIVIAYKFKDAEQYIECTWRVNSIELEGSIARFPTLKDIVSMLNKVLDYRNIADYDKTSQDILLKMRRTKEGILSAKRQLVEYESQLKLFREKKI